MRTLAFLLLLLVVPVSAEPLPPGLVEAYRTLTRSWVKLDADLVITNFTDDFNSVDGRGVSHDRAGWRDLINWELSKAKSCNVSYQVVSWNMQGTVVVARVHQEQDFEYKEKRLVRTSEREDHWRKTDDGWKICFVKYIKQTAHIEVKATKDKE